MADKEGVFVLTSRVFYNFFLFIFALGVSCKKTTSDHSYYVEQKDQQISKKNSPKKSIENTTIANELKVNIDQTIDMPPEQFPQKEYVSKVQTTEKSEIKKKLKKTMYPLLNEVDKPQEIVDYLTDFSHGFGAGVRIKTGFSVGIINKQIALINENIVFDDEIHLSCGPGRTASLQLPSLMPNAHAAFGVYGIKAFGCKKASDTSGLAFYYSLDISPMSTMAAASGRIGMRVGIDEDRFVSFIKFLTTKEAKDLLVVEQINHEMAQFKKIIDKVLQKPSLVKAVSFIVFFSYVFEVILGYFGWENVPNWLIEAIKLFDFDRILKILSSLFELNNVTRLPSNKYALALILKNYISYENFPIFYTLGAYLVSILNGCDAFLIGADAGVRLQPSFFILPSTELFYTTAVNKGGLNSSFSLQQLLGMKNGLGLFDEIEGAFNSVNEIADEVGDVAEDVVDTVTDVSQEVVDVVVDPVESFINSGNDVRVINFFLSLKDLFDPMYSINQCIKPVEKLRFKLYHSLRMSIMKSLPCINNKEPCQGIKMEELLDFSDSF